MQFSDFSHRSSWQLAGRRITSFLSFIRIYKNDIYESDYDYSILLNEKHNILKTKEATYNEDIA